MRPYNPGPALTGPVWAGPRSLATTCGITIVFSSSGYLDVSVRRVGPLSGGASSRRRVAPFGNPRIEACVRLPAEYRCLSRPSSPARAKASPVRPSLLPRAGRSRGRPRLFPKPQRTSPPAPAGGTAPRFPRGENKNERSARRVEDNGFEPLTPCVQGRCSSQLS